MKISLDWLQEFVTTGARPEELKELLTGLGLGVESFERVGDDWVLDVEVTTNRPDCLSELGVAREIAAASGKPLREPQINFAESQQATASRVSIEILEPDLCARYCGRLLLGVEAKPSPAWLRNRLGAVGVRPVNNIADVTNYVLMELGHPLHAFDFARLRQGKIVVRRARAAEKLRTLDGAERTLEVSNLVIADGERAVALAGIMGGEETGISSTTRNVLLESAWFNPLSVRRTAKAHGLHTEASHRFERGADIEMAPRALGRAAAMIQEIAGGEILRGQVDVYARPWKPVPLRLRASEIRRILGTDIPWENVVRVLRSLGFALEEGVAGEGRVFAPSFRLDVAGEVDLIEEVARHTGYDRLPARLRPAPPQPYRDARRERVLAISKTLTALRYHEILTYSLVDPAENLLFSSHPAVRLSNPLSQEASVLRTTPIPSLLAVLAWNLDRHQTDLRLFEIGKIYRAFPARTPQENDVLVLGLCGNRRAQTVHDQEKRTDFFDLKGHLESLLGEFAIPELHFVPETDDHFEKSLSGRFLSRSEPLAQLGRLRGEILAHYKLRSEVWLGEVDLERLFTFDLMARSFQAYAKYPAAERDLSLILPAEVRYDQVAEAVRKLDMPEVLDFQPVDLYAGQSIEEGKYSLLVRIKLQSASGTLENEKITAACERIVASLAPLGISLRPSA